MNDAERQFYLKAKEVTDGMSPVDMPPVPANAARLEQPPPGFTYCAGRPQGCTKVIPEAEVTYHWTGIIKARDSLCRECQALTPEHALVVCLRCCAVVARVPPHTFPDGFRIEARRAYHLRNCGNCVPELPSSRIIEGELYRRNK